MGQLLPYYTDEGRKIENSMRCVWGGKNNYMYASLHIIFHISNGQLKTFPEKTSNYFKKAKSLLCPQIIAHSTKYWPHSHGS